MVTFLSFDQQNLIMVNNEVTTIATEFYRFCDFVFILVFSLLSFFDGLEMEEKNYYGFYVAWSD